MSQDSKVVVLDAEVSNSTRSEKAKEYFPDRFFEMFIAEQNMVSVAVGLARRGYKPYVSTFAAFLTRAHDQIRMAGLNESNITFVGSHAGVSIGADGSSQMGLGDIAMFSAILDSKVFYPSDIVSAKKIIHKTKDLEGIKYIRTTREKTALLYEDNHNITVGGEYVLYASDKDVAGVIAAGITLQEAIKAYTALKIQGIFIRIIDFYSIKPVDSNFLISAVEGLPGIIVVEDHYKEGGLGASVKDILPCNKITHLCVNNMPHSGTPEELLRYEKIDFNAIMEAVQNIINNNTN
jgi:transketolase